MVIHIVPDEEDFDTVYQSLKNPPQYLALGRYEDLLDIERVDIVRIHPENEVDLKRDMYIPVENEWEKDEEKIKIMNKLAMYEQGEGKKYLPVSKYYRSDYIGLALIKNFFLITIGYVLIVAAVAVYFGEYLLENIHKMNLVALGAYIIIGYLVVLVFYSVLTYIQYSVKYYRAKKSVREYYSQLTSLSKIYAREERKASGKGAAGGYRK